MAVRKELWLSSEDKQLTARELVQRRMNEHRDMTTRLAKLEQPVVDMTPGGPVRN